MPARFVTVAASSPTRVWTPRFAPDWNEDVLPVATGIRRTRAALHPPQQRCLSQPSLLQRRDLGDAPPATAHPQAWDSVSVNYTGWTTDGKMFDTSAAQGEPVTLELDKVIKGWTEGLQRMVEGEARRSWIPAKLAYGNSPRAGLPSGMLVFDVELVRIVPGKKPIEVPSDVAGPPKHASKTASGLAYFTLTKGNGKSHPHPRDRVRVHYSGWTTDGKMFGP
jgi:FKBP-type peptidyl-prolyl cis-trans isomerase